MFASHPLVSYKLLSNIPRLEIIAGMITDQDVHAKNDQLLVAKDQEITYPVIARLQNFNLQTGVKEPFAVIKPMKNIRIMIKCFGH